MRYSTVLLLLVASTLTFSCAQETTQMTIDDELMERAQSLAQEGIIVDGHIDVPYRLTEERYEDISERTEGGDFDYARAKAGGLDAPFMSIYIESRYQDTGGAKAQADRLIDLVNGFIEDWPEKFAGATSVADVRANHDKGLISLPMGMENGAGLEGDLANLRYFYNRGIRYITLTHATDNLICDSSYDTTGTWGGLSAFGRQVVTQMNKLGIMIDISHVSDSAFYQVLEITEAPVIASHSSMRSFTPGWERNMNDDMLRALADNGGVVMINFGSSFLKTEYQAEGREIRENIETYLEENEIDPKSDEGFTYTTTQRRANPVGTIDDVVAHIEHVVDLVGIDHVGLGSDYDGVFSLPSGLQDVSEFPNLIYELLRKGYSEDDIRKILGENALRVWGEVERIAKTSN